jgi:phosphotriesterase-related protein
MAEEQDARAAPQVITVRGMVEAAGLGPWLCHEHVMVDFIGAEKASPERYDADEVIRHVLPRLRRARTAGAEVFVDCTPAYLGRDVHILDRLSIESGLHILTNTGYYGAANDLYIPTHAHAETAGQLAARWVSEWRNGIDGSGIRPGFIKTGVDTGPLSDMDAKLIRAAAKAHLATGLTIASHTTDAKAVEEEIALLAGEGVGGAAFIWVHAHTVPAPELHAKAARQGVWVEFDGLSPDSIDLHVDLVSNMKKRGLLSKVLVSHDAGWYSVGEPDGGAFRPYDTLFTHFIPALRNKGFSEAEIWILTTQNPANAYSIGVRAV